MAEIYYTTRIPGRTGNACGWSKAPGFPSLLAVSLGNNAVGVYNEEGRPIDPNNELIIKNVRGSEALQMAWHPLLPLLAIGWKDGAISFWNAEERHLEEDSKTHRSPVSSMTWNGAGDRLFTTDENAKLSVWKTDRLMRPIHIVSFDEQPGCRINLCALGPTETNPESGAISTTVFYGVNQNNVTVLKWANDLAYSGLVLELSDEAQALIYYPEKDQLLVTTGLCSMHLLAKDEAMGTWSTISKMKFATGTGESATTLQVCWACDHTLASASEKDNVVRMYNFDTEDNYVLPIDSADSVTVSRIVSLCSDSRSHLLAAGTLSGNITVFRYNPPSKDGDPLLDLTKCWEIQPSFKVGDRVKSMEWGLNPRLMVIKTLDGIYACRKTLLRHKFRDGFAVVQTGVDSLVIEGTGDIEGNSSKLKTQLQILGLDFSKGNLLVYDGSQADIYKVSETCDVMEAGSFESASRAMAIHNDSIFRAAEGRIEVLTHSGTIKQTLAFDEPLHGTPILLDVCRDFLASVTSLNYVRVYKVAGREAKPHAGPGLVIPAELKHLKVDQMAVNSTGTMVSVLCSSKEKLRETRMFVYCSENNSIQSYDFNDDAGRVPQSMLWDVVESKLLAVQVLAHESDLLDSDPTSGGQTVTQVALLFVSPDHGVLMQEYQDIVGSAKGLVGLQAPHLILNQPRTLTQPTGQTLLCSVTKTTMQGFAGMNDIDDTVRSALLEFSYNLAIDNMDEAFRAVKAIKSTTVWETMAHLCIKNKRLDVAEHCLGKMENARGARAAREARSITELDARVAAVAVHLNMVEDAKKLYVSSERYDLLNRLYQASGQWEKALEVAEKNDRIHLKTTHYAFAKHLEKTGSMQEALKHYEMSGCSNVEVPRMFFDSNQVEELDLYVKGRPENKDLMLWWARYSESLGDFETAFRLYDKAGDALSTVRILCHTRRIAEAEEEVARLGDPAAAFHLARQFESMDRIPDAIRYYTQAKRFSHGVRLAKNHELDSELMNLALKSTPLVMIDAADYLNEKGEHDKAATLYMKGGKISKAVEMCFAAKLYDVLQTIADDLQQGQDPALFTRCAEFFMSAGHFDKAAKMLIAAGQYTQALEMCVTHEVVITEEMAEAMTPSKDVMGTEERNLVLQRIAKIAKKQGSWQLAAKKYTQAGDKVKAMKALLRSGDQEKIIFFAGVSRQKDIYMMAANYLQTLDWHSEPEIMKNIISFYTKAQAMDNLAHFYETCAQIEIDEYRDYDKALLAMAEAVKYLGKSKSEDREVEITALQRRIELTEKFSSARQLITNPHTAQQALSVCGQVLLAIPSGGHEIEKGVRVGDVYALMVEYWYEQGNAQEAYKLIEQMRSRGIVVSPYLDQKLIADVYQALGLEVFDERQGQHRSGGGARHQQQDDEDENFIEEEIPDYE